ncbi:MAG: hypothetical protein OXB86_01710 [Bdellovibrionales bacterium]|nr:hypothetical protein [Bdellovibrionales bacterium]
MLRFFLLFCILLITGCSHWFNPVVSQLASSSSENFFTSEQREDMARLLDEILHSEECDELIDAIESNSTIAYLKEEYEVKEDFVYGELNNFYNPQFWLQVSKESYLIRGIVTAWLAEKDPATVKLAIEKVQSCY